VQLVRVAQAVAEHSHPLYSRRQRLPQHHEMAATPRSAPTPTSSPTVLPTAATHQLHSVRGTLGVGMVQIVVQIEKKKHTLSDKVWRPG
jgi:hypothetical protein